MKKIVKKKVGLVKKTNKKVLLKGGAKNGALYAVAILAIVATFGGVMAGGAVPEILKLNTPTPPSDPYSCCDTGDGAACHPITENSFIFNGQTYALLKSKIYQGEAYHIAPAELDETHGYQPSYTPDGRRIFVNMSDHTAMHSEIPGCEPGKDLIAVRDPSNPSRSCHGLPDEQLIYVCSDTPEECSKNINKEVVPFDVYYRVSDGPVPQELSNYCPKPKEDLPSSSQRIVGLPTPSGTANLQLETFKVEQEKKTYTWLGAWCKPADYFYPKEKTDISFDVAPKGEFTYTIPSRQADGWKFSAYPDGKIVHNGKNYPYIYWDASIPNDLINIPTKGYSIEKNELKNFLADLLPRLGLNKKETSEFVDYWAQHLPNSKYYFVGIIPQTEIDGLAPLTISPTPDSVLRVTLYFKTTDKKELVDQPKIEGFDRKGFSVVEWGAILDTQKHPGFSCLM